MVGVRGMPGAASACPPIDSSECTPVQVLGEHDASVRGMLEHFGLRLKPAAFKQDVKPLLKEACSAIFGGAAGLVDMMVAHLPSSKAGSALKARPALPCSPAAACDTPLKASPHTAEGCASSGHGASCSNRMHTKFRTLPPKHSKPKPLLSRKIPPLARAGRLHIQRARGRRGCEAHAPLQPLATPVTPP